MSKTIGENIRRARVINKISISELAARTRIPERKIKSYENGDNFQGMSDVIRIAKELNLSLDFFFDKSDLKIRLRKNKMTERDKRAALELARYKSRGPADLAIILGMQPFLPIPKMDSLSYADAKKLGERMAGDWSTGEPLSSILESRGIFVIKIQVETALFRGLLVVREGVPVIAISERERELREVIEDISHEVGHTVFLNQGMNEEEEEPLCDAFSEGFSKVFIEKSGENIGRFDFVERSAVEAWRQGLSTASFSAEAMGLTTLEFLERFSDES